MIRTFNYPLHPTATQESALLRTLSACQQLYNAALEQRIDAYRKQRKTLSNFDQQKELTALRKYDSVFSSISRTVLTSALTRLDRAYGSFFRRVKRGENPGFPRFRNRDRYRSFSFPFESGTNTIKDNLIRIPVLGLVRFHKYRLIRGTPKEARVRRTAKGWSLSIVCDIGSAPSKVDIQTSTGIDLGLNNYATLANGEQYTNPRFYRESEALLIYRQQKLALKKIGSKSRLKAKRLVGLAHTRIKNQRLDFLRKLSNILIAKYDLIVYEDLKIKNMTHGNLAKSIHDASWGIFINCIKSKAEEAGKHAIGVNPRGTSQRCSRCATIPVTKKTLADRVHFCETCGLSLDRDHNAAINIHALGLSAVHGVLPGTKLTEVY